jgi:predicted alternative tryptophan synthase beta-subunit
VTQEGFPVFRAPATRDDTKYTLGSVLNHVLLHQSVIGLEAEKQMQMMDDFPDVVIGCVGGGSNFAGLAFPFLRHQIAGKDIRFVAVEAVRCRDIGREECILFNLSGHGICDLPSYDRFLNGDLEDYAYPQAKIEKALAELPTVE